MSVSSGFPYASAVENPNSSVPAAKIISLANILGSCVNTGSSTSTPCTKLFDNAMSGNATRGGKPATDEASAIFNIVHHPVQNVSELFALIPTIPAFGGGLTAVPADFTLPIVYNSVVEKAVNIAFDAAGNAWISDLTKMAVIRVGPQGAVHTYTGGGTFGAISSVAVEPPPARTVWAADKTNNQIYVLNPDGSVRETITRGGLSQPSGIAFDRSGQAYVVNRGNFNICEYSPSGESVATPIYSTALGSSVAIAVDYSGWAYTPTNASSPGIGGLVSGQPEGYFFQDYASGYGINTSLSVALDSTSNTPTITYFGISNVANSNFVWQVNTNGKLLKLSLADYGLNIKNNYQAQTFLVISYAGGLSPTSSPATLSIDGATNLWIANAGANVVSGFAHNGIALAPNGFPTGASPSSFSDAAAVDGSGNVWTANSDGRVTQLLGLSVPVATPIFPGQFAIMP
jgi:hypothetical protein